MSVKRRDRAVRAESEPKCAGGEVATTAEAKTSATKCQLYEVSVDNFYQYEGYRCVEHRQTVVRGDDPKLIEKETGGKVERYQVPICTRAAMEQDVLAGLLQQMTELKVKIQESNDRIERARKSEQVRHWLIRGPMGRSGESSSHVILCDDGKAAVQYAASKYRTTTDHVTAQTITDDFFAVPDYRRAALEHAALLQQQEAVARQEEAKRKDQQQAAKRIRELEQELARLKTTHKTT